MNCGGCMACCIHLNIEPTDSPAGEWCVNCDNGCKIYKNRPTFCREFECVYSLEDNISLKMRPDKTGIIFEKIYTRIYLAIITEPAFDNWETDMIVDYIKQLNDDGISVIACSLTRGIQEVFSAENHDPKVVVELAQRVV